MWVVSRACVVALIEMLVARSCMRGTGRSTAFWGWAKQCRVNHGECDNVPEYMCESVPNGKCCSVPSGKDWFCARSFVEGLRGGRHIFFVGESGMLDLLLLIILSLSPWRILLCQHCRWLRIPSFPRGEVWGGA